MSREEYIARVKRLNPIDDDLFRKMAEDQDFCEELIQTIMGNEKLEVLEVKQQDAIKNLQGRSVVLDAHCIWGDGEHINIEVQKADDDDHQRRVRYNAACITANITDPGSKFEQVPSVCVIYITKNDFLKKGKTTYHVDRVLRETGDVVDNGFSEIYVNARIKDGTPTAQLMTIFTENEAYDHERFPATSKRKQHFKEDEKGVSEMCDIMREVKEEGIAEGIERGRQAGIAEGRQAGIAEGRQAGIAEGIEQGVERTIMQMYARGKLTQMEACESLNYTPEEFEQCVEKYSKQD